jgi:hypothetical protein
MLLREFVGKQERFSAGPEGRAFFALPQNPLHLPQMVQSMQRAVQHPLEPRRHDFPDHIIARFRGLRIRQFGALDRQLPGGGTWNRMG